MNTYYLPDDILSGSPVHTDEVVIRSYTSGQDSVKNRNVLNQNMINLLVSGTKTVIYPDATALVNADKPLVIKSLYSAKLVSTPLNCFSPALLVVPL